MAALSVYLGGLCVYRDKLASGEKGIVLLIAPDMRQARVALDYAEGCLDTPIMRQLHCGRTAETLTLTNGISLEVRSSSFRRIRGMTCVTVLPDECAFWLANDSANQAEAVEFGRVQRLEHQSHPLQRSADMFGNRANRPLVFG